MSLGRAADGTPTSDLSTSQAWGYGMLLYGAIGWQTGVFKVRPARPLAGLAPLGIVPLLASDRQ
ncbi:MAG: hypothetical protein OXD01_00650 [Gammaproteobacteria bacterium]|nr:hypothetical protein [Gammaproteobacteria bacterium]